MLYYEFFWIFCLSVKPIYSKHLPKNEDRKLILGKNAQLTVLFFLLLTFGRFLFFRLNFKCLIFMLIAICIKRSFFYQEKKEKYFWANFTKSETFYWGFIKISTFHWRMHCHSYKTERTRHRPAYQPCLVSSYKDSQIRRPLDHWIELLNKPKKAVVLWTALL